MEARLVERGSLLYVHAFGTQAAEVLARIGERLTEAGVSKADLLTARIVVADERFVADCDTAWRAWVDPARQPLTVRRLGEPASPARLLDITVTAPRAKFAL